jgi:hypothetical protein
MAWKPMQRLHLEVRAQAVGRALLEPMAVPVLVAVPVLGLAAPSALAVTPETQVREAEVALEVWGRSLPWDGPPLPSEWVSRAA